MYQQQFAKRLKIARQRQEMTQYDTAKELNIDQSAISRYEKGELEPNIETLAKMIDLYQIDANWLLDTQKK